MFNLNRKCLFRFQIICLRTFSLIGQNTSLISCESLSSSLRGSTITIKKIKPMNEEEFKDLLYFQDVILPQIYMEEDYQIKKDIEEQEADSYLASIEAHDKYD